MNNTRKFIDNETDKIITIEELKIVFEELKTEQPEEYNYSFEDYIKNCTDKNGTLTELDEFNTVEELADILCFEFPDLYTNYSQACYKAEKLFETL